MTALLVSVRSPQECTVALRSAVSVIDIKEPRHGSLGAADSDVVQQIVTAVGGRLPVSVALGELQDFQPDRFATLPAVDFLKIGLAGCAALPCWRQRWQAAWHELPEPSRRVAVAYADAELAKSPPWIEVLEAGQESGCRVLLVDTYDKSAGGLLDWVSRPQLQQLRELTHAAGLELALAGSLTRLQVVELLEWQPDYIAVRSAACRGQRSGDLSRECIEQLVADVRAFNHGTESRLSSRLSSRRSSDL